MYWQSPCCCTLASFPSNVKEWVSIYMEYKFKRPIPIHRQGLASHLARHITDPTLQKSSMVANGE